MTSPVAGGRSAPRPCLVVGADPRRGLIVRAFAGLLAITAYHVAGPVAFYPTDPMEVSAFLISPVLPTTHIRLGKRLTIPGAHVLSFDDTQYDIAAFRVRDWRPARALPLGTVVPAV